MVKILIYSLCLIFTAFIRQSNFKVTEKRDSNSKLKLDDYESINIKNLFNINKNNSTNRQNSINTEINNSKESHQTTNLSSNSLSSSNQEGFTQFFKSFKSQSFVYEINSGLESTQILNLNNETNKILEVYPAQNAPGFTLDLFFGSPERSLTLNLDIFNSYSYILSQNMKNETFNKCAQIFDYYNKNNSKSYRKDDSKVFNSKIFLKDFNFTGTPSLEEAYMDITYFNRTKFTNFAFYLVENTEIKYNGSKCLAIFGGLGLGFSSVPGINFIDQLKQNGIIQQKIFALLLPLQTDNTYLHLGGFRKEWINDTNMINWADVSLIPKIPVIELNDASGFSGNSNGEYVMSTSGSKETKNMKYDLKSEINGLDEEVSFKDSADGDENDLIYNQKEIENDNNINNNDNEISKNIVASNDILNKIDYKGAYENSESELENLIKSSIESSNDNNVNLKNLTDESFSKNNNNNQNSINSKLNWHLTANKIYLRKEVYAADHKIVFNTLSDNVMIPKTFFFQNYKNIFGSDTDCKIEQDGYFYCKCYPYYSENFPVFYLEFNSKFNITINPQDYVQVIINYSDDDIRPCRLLLKLNYSDDFWELGYYVMNNFYLIFNQETNQVGFFDRKYINQIDNDQAMLLILIVSLGSIVLFLIIYALFKKYVDRNNSENALVNNPNPAQRNLI